MDQGLAAFLAGMAALLGALIGGGFTAWGARIGGEKTVEAARQQVKDQAHVESKRWLLQARHDAYRVILGATESYMNALIMPTPEAEAEVAKQLFHSAKLRVELVGPDTVRSAVGELSFAFVVVQRVIDDGRSVESWMVEKLSERHRAFLDAVTAVYAMEPDAARDIP
ncbi:hypothetical protein QQY66_27405 [Streptomyces sp. DG2A-72]|uniref:hypothetical protein n=1 Tax=Streptomyces sp. DG2A-72 TaxID=3051386 RepID=UPI00265C3C33|nr:hypothetical protein [Streptomyces sp. DG2A-72]MDO0935215.1 hypothetical protein [Streptomyces sp. DG2A-72]